MLTAVFNASRHNPFWLTLTNIILGAAVLLCLAVIALEVLCEARAHRKSWRSYDAELDHDMQEMFAASHPPVVFAHTTPPGASSKLLESVCRHWRRLSHRHH
ncbi:MAG TPA: hypothetical protein VMJ75_04465 [Candidatus Acidoferrales bacterium]|nr:hypothetical protein [Candidatus Acidoferrales bacterium]